MKHDEDWAPVTLPTQASGSACQTVRGGLTDEEVEVLTELRAVRERVNMLRAELATAATMRRHEIGAELDRLAAEGRRLTGERDATRHRRMVLLGHEQP